MTYVPMRTVNRLEKISSQPKLGRVDTTNDLRSEALYDSRWLFDEGPLPVGLPAVFSCGVAAAFIFGAGTSATALQQLVWRQTPLGGSREK